ncbi:MAG: histidine kinase [Pseudomonadota bacterium]
MKYAAQHPFALYNARRLALTAALLAVGCLAGKLHPCVFAAEFTALVLGYAAVAIILFLGRRVEQPRAIATLAFVATIVGMVLANNAALSLGAQLAQVPPEAIPAVTSAVMILSTWPELWKRWSAWREQRVLAEQAARHASERALLEARLTALQGQIEPHFLFNTLANVQYLLKRDADKAGSMMEHLIAYLRATLPEMRQVQTPLAQELTRVRAYLDIMQIRMGERLHYQIDCPSELEAVPILPLSLATLVENALQHGLENKPGGGSIHVSAWREHGRVCVAVDDDGPGFSETGGSGGVGLRNLRERLQALYAGAASFTLEARASGGVRACLSFPFDTASAS